MSLLDVKNLRVRFETHHGTVHAVDGVSFTLEEGETLGLVGESGSGKSVTNLALMGLIPSPPGVVGAERVMYGKRNLLKMPDEELRKIRGNEIAMIFQDPMTSLNPLLTVERQLTEVLMLHRGKTCREARKLAAAGLGDVGIPNPEERLDAYPHELSGGMRQRVMIAMGLLCKPRLLIADEPTTALDVTIQAQILELMKDLQKKNGMAIILVTHDLGVVAGMTDRINVMYAGRLAETAPTDELFARPQHPYTRGLLASVPTLGGDPNADLYSIPGAPPDLAGLGPGCAFGPRCDLYTRRCDEQKPTLKIIKDAVTGVERRAACFEISSAPAKGEDPNKELFAELERQEAAGNPTDTVVWSASEREEELADDSAPEADAARDTAKEESETEASAEVVVLDSGEAEEAHAEAVEDADEDEALLSPPLELREPLELTPPLDVDDLSGDDLSADDLDDETVGDETDEDDDLEVDLGQEVKFPLPEDNKAEEREQQDDPFALDAPEDSALDLDAALDLDGADLSELEDDLDDDWKWIGAPPEETDSEDEDKKL